MINDIKQSIVDRLRELYPGYTIYDEDVPQNFKKQSFLITLTDQDYNKRLNSKYKSLISFDIAYFSNKRVTEIKLDCQNIQMSLFRSFDLVGSYRVLNKQAVITDNVLHFTFDIQFYETKEEVSEKMQKQQTNTNI